MKKKKQKSYKTVSAMIYDLSGRKAAREFRATLKKKRRHGQEINPRSLPTSGF